MSKLAKQLTSVGPSVERVRRGPANRCTGIYEPDIEDWEAIEEFRNRPTESWATAQRHWDALANVTANLPNDKFRYHWRRRCYCWPDELRLG